MGRSVSEKVQPWKDTLESGESNKTNGESHTTKCDNAHADQTTARANAVKARWLRPSAMFVCKSHRADQWPEVATLDGRATVGRVGHYQVCRGVRSDEFKQEHVH